MPKCLYPSDNHSEDRYIVYHGTTTPLDLCGYHATQFNLNHTLHAIREANQCATH